MKTKLKEKIEIEFEFTQEETNSIRKVEKILIALRPYFSTSNKENFYKICVNGREYSHSQIEKMIIFLDSMYYNDSSWDLIKAEKGNE